MRKKEGKLNTLDGTLNEIWKMLNRGATHYHDPFADRQWAGTKISSRLKKGPADFYFI